MSDDITGNDITEIMNTEEYLEWLNYYDGVDMLIGCENDELINFMGD